MHLKTVGISSSLVLLVFLVGRWLISGMSWSLLTLNSDGFAKNFHKTISKMTKEQKKLFAVVIWSLWRRRNDKLWANKKKCYIMQQLVSQATEARNYLQEWSYFQNKHQSSSLILPHSSSITSWQRLQ